MYGDKRPGSTLLHSCVNVEMHPSRMLQVSRISENLPVFPSKALRASSSSSARFFAGEWLIVVAGNKLFLWKYSRYVNTQPHSSCVSFDLPVSDLPHSASLVGLLFPSNDAEVSPLPTSCLALSSCGGNLRLWPRLTRNYVHVDTVLPAPIGGLYGDQAIQLEHIHVSGAFVAATRTGHLVLIDTRNAQDGVKTHLITSTNDGCMHSKGILSGLGRRVSNFFNLVSSTTNSGLIKSMPARGGENFVFLRLITCMSSNDCEKCFCFALYKNQLDVWSVDYNLNCELCDVYTIDKLINSSSSSLEDGDSDWEAVDFAIQSNRYASSTADQTLAYILLSRIDDQQSPRELRLLTVKFNRIESSLCFTINASVGVEYPFYEDRLYTSEETNIQFCLPADSTPQSLYPCLLGCLYCLRTGQVFIIEVLTGQIIGKLEFSPNLPNKPPCPQSLISIGSSDMHSLFIFLTCQCGLLTLTPCIDSGNNNAGTINEVMDAIPSSSGGISMIDVDQASLVSSEVSLNRSMHKSRSSIVSCPTILSQKHHSEPDFSIIVHTVDEKRLKVNTMFTANTYIISLVGESFDKPIKLSPMDRLFVALCEVARIYWMGFKEQTINYMKSILHDHLLVVIYP
uniref:Nucleoporin Nup133/Nup155-like N-terminal domain-containing protein n=1 Tax=Trichobilharzia regenti TaxID=157069 RepID=A0AA85JQ49_TRIRE|nr:unnamed protein product [Trichobilharzia regenti]